MTETGWNPTRASYFAPDFSSVAIHLKTTLGWPRAYHHPVNGYSDSTKAAGEEPIAVQQKGTDNGLVADGEPGIVVAAVQLNTAAVDDLDTAVAVVELEKNAAVVVACEVALELGTATHPCAKAQGFDRAAAIGGSGDTAAAHLVPVKTAVAGESRRGSWASLDKAVWWEQHNHWLGDSHCDQKMGDFAGAGRLHFSLHTDDSDRRPTN